MTREDIFKLLNKHQDNDTLDIKTAKEMVNIIYDEHEAQLKLASDVYSTDKMHMYQELKAKDEEIAELEQHGKTMYKLMLSGENRGVQKGIVKARSIVAMLFWEWRKNIRLHGKKHYFTISSWFAFQQAYKMLKDTPC